jgi:hypothetical protein
MLSHPDAKANRDSRRKGRTMAELFTSTASIRGHIRFVKYVNPLSYKQIGYCRPYWCAREPLAKFSEARDLYGGDSQL